MRAVGHVAGLPGPPAGGRPGTGGGSPAQGGLVAATPVVDGPVVVGDGVVGDGPVGDGVAGPAELPEAAAGALAASPPIARRTAFGPALAAVYTGQLARARVARIPLLFVAAFQSVGILLLLRGVVDTGSSTTREQVVAGASVLVIAFVALNLLAQRFGALRASGALDYYLSLPVPRSAVVLGTAGSYATFAVPGTIVTAVFGALLYDLPLGRLWMLVPVLVLAGASLAGLGAAIGLIAPKPELATIGGQLGMSVVLFLGIIPADRLPLVIRGVRAIVPSTYAVDALADTFHHRVHWVGVVVDLLVCAAVAVVSLAIAAVALRRAGRA